MAKTSKGDIILCSPSGKQDGVLMSINALIRRQETETRSQISIFLFFALIASPLLDDFLLRFRGRQC